MQPHDLHVKCPSCDQLIVQNSMPVRGYSTGDGSDGWLCPKCPAVVCVWCYTKHIEAVHPEVYHGKKGIGKKQKRRK